MTLPSVSLALAVGLSALASFDRLPASARDLSRPEHPGCITVAPGARASAARVIAGCTRALRQPSLSPFEMAALHSLRAAAHAAARNLPGALADLSHAARMAPRDPLIARHYGSMLHRTGQLDAAEAELTRALRLEPHAEVWLARCAVRGDLGRHREAIADCETAHATDPSERSTLLTARAYLAAGRLDSALLTLKDAARSNPASVEIRSLLAATLKASGPGEHSGHEAGGEPQSPAAKASRR